MMVLQKCIIFRRLEIKQTHRAFGEWKKKGGCIPLWKMAGKKISALIPVKKNVFTSLLRCTSHSNIKVTQVSLNGCLFSTAKFFIKSISVVMTKFLFLTIFQIAFQLFLQDVIFLNPWMLRF